MSFVRDLPSCDCQSSEFCDPHHKHIVSGDLRVVSNQKLRKLLSKGPNYREPRTLNYNKCKKEINTTLLLAIDNLSVKYHLEKEDFTSWKNKIVQLVDQRVEVLKSKKVPSKTNSPRPGGPPWVT